MPIANSIISRALGFASLQYMVLQVVPIWPTLDLPTSWVKGEKIQIFNYGNCKRDFTYIDDIVEGVYRVMMRPPKGKEASPQPSPKGKGVHTADPMQYDLLKTYAEENRKNPTEAESVLWT